MTGIDLSVRKTFSLMVAITLSIQQGTNTNRNKLQEL